MSTIVQVRPDSSVSSSGTSIGGGAADNDDAVRRISNSDTSTTTYVLTSASATFTVGLANMTPLTVDQRISRVRVRAGVGFGGAGGQLTAQVKSAAALNASFTNTNTGASYKEITGSWLDTNPNGGVEWTEAAINALQLVLTQSASGSVSIFWVELDIEIRDRPLVNVTSPATDSAVDPVLDNMLVKWSYIGDAPYHYGVKIFTAVIVEGGGFDPNTSSAVYVSGTQVGSNQHDVNGSGVVLTASTSYYVFVRASTIVPGVIGEWYSDWNGQRFHAGSTPVVNVTAPTGAIATAQPTMTHTYSDADGKVASSYRRRIFLRPGGSWTGFDPDAAVAVYSDFITDGSLSSQIGIAALANSSVYRAYVDASGAIPYSWLVRDFEDFTTSWTAPATPTMVATADAANFGRVKFVLTNNSNHASVRVFLQRSLDGINWTYVRGVYNLDIGFNIATTLYDYEAPPHTTMQYRAWVTSSVSGVPTQSLTAIATLSVNTKFNFLKDPIDSARDVHAITQGEWLDRTHSRDRVLYKAIGRTRPIPMRGTATGETFTVSIITRTEAERTALKLLLDSDRVLVWQTTRILQYVDLASDYNESEYMWADLRPNSPLSRIFTVNFVEVDVLP